MRAQIDPGWSGPTLVAAVLDTLSDKDVLVLGASNPIRDADLAPISAHPPLVYANRGLAGIDGTIATACGVAAGLNRPVVGIVGDLTALHDISSLALPALERGVDLTLVVADDRGGSIFATMEYGAPHSQIGDLADWFERLFAVPMGVDLAEVARGFGVPVVPVSDVSELAAALANPGGIRIVHARLDRSDRAGADKRLAASGRQAVRTVAG